VWIGKIKQIVDMADFAKPNEDMVGLATVPKQICLLLQFSRRFLGYRLVDELKLFFLNPSQK